MKASFVISLAILLLIVAVLTHGIVEGICALIAFSLVFYYASLRWSDHQSSKG